MKVREIDRQILIEGIKDYDRFTEIIENYTSFDQATALMKNQKDVEVMNEDEDLFDFNYRSISGTVYADDNNIAYVGSIFDIWNDRTCELVLEQTNKENVNKILGK